MNKPITVLLAIAVMASFWTFGDAQAFRLITQEMVEKELVVETDLIRTADNFIILFDTSSSTNQMVPGKNTTKIQAAKNLLKERNAWFPNLGFKAGLYIYTDNQTLTGTFREVYGLQAYDRERFAAGLRIGPFLEVLVRHLGDLLEAEVHQLLGLLPLHALQVLHGHVTQLMRFLHHGLSPPAG